MSSPSLLDPFEVVPKKTFFDLGKSRGHCFILPKRTYKDIQHIFDLSKTNLQCIINLQIDSLFYPAELRMANIDRSKTYKLPPEELSRRIVFLIQWGKFEDTQLALREFFEESYNEIIQFEKNTIEKAIFTHIETITFCITKEKTKE